MTSDVEFESRSLEELSSAGTLIMNDGYRTKRADLGDVGFQILRVAQVQDGALQPPSEPEFVREEFRSKIGPKLAQPGDIILTTKGTVGRRARVPITEERLVYSPQVCFFRVLDEETVDPDYFYYWLAGPEFLVQAAGIKAQTDMADYISLRDLRKVRVSLPAIEIQREVGQALRFLDDRIGLNRRMSATLERTSRTIFRTWFVDFDSVRAKMDGRETGLPSVLFDLFPDQLVQSELGEIPEGWQVLSLSDLGRFLNGLAMQKYPPTDERFLPVIKIAQLRAGHTNGADRASADLDPDYVVDDGDILFLGPARSSASCGLAAEVP